MEKLHRSEGDINISERRRRWQEENLDEATRELLAEDEKYFLKQSLSTPCPQRHAGLWGASGSRTSRGGATWTFTATTSTRSASPTPRSSPQSRPSSTGFPFAPGATPTPWPWIWPESSPKSRPGDLKQGALLPRRGRSHRHGAQARADRHGPPQDDLHVGLLPRRLARRDLDRRRGRSSARTWGRSYPAPNTCRRRTSTTASTSAGAAAAVRHDVRPLRGVRAGEGGGRRRG